MALKKKTVTKNVRQPKVNKTRRILKGSLKATLIVSDVCYKAAVLFFLWQIAGSNIHITHQVHSLMEFLWIRM